MYQRKPNQTTAMASEPLPPAAAATPPENRHRSIFDLHVNFFDSCRLLSPYLTSLFQPLSISENSSSENPNNIENIEERSTKTGVALPRWTCNTFKAEFDSLQDQRSHFKSDIHRLNVKLSIASKDAVKEEGFDESMDSYKDFEVSSISGSEDEADKGAYPHNYWWLAKHSTDMLGGPRLVRNSHPKMQPGRLLSAEAALRWHNELALKKIFRKFKSCLLLGSLILKLPHVFLFMLLRAIEMPTLKEAKRIYSQLTEVSYEVEKEIPPGIKEDMLSSSTNNNGNLDSCKVELEDNLSGNDASKIPPNNVKADTISSESDSEVVCSSTPLHEAAQSGDAQKVMELLVQGLDPCIKDQRGRTPYMLASEKEVRNMFRRFMAANLEKWDWSSAKVPSALTKEMEES
ncbi:putative SNARE associated Golgi protein family [Hibiscus syriacus]|uniref:SNARE associated Golgi protein family n=1 Tax=Hibiscus syriacus TaxID=106335 RepID=A0A6A3ABW8_HIBSY|nr:putative SNARE associated Golgi protein family [Hibiscus syriacus]